MADFWYKKFAHGAMESCTRNRPRTILHTRKRAHIIALERLFCPWYRAHGKQALVEETSKNHTFSSFCTRRMQSFRYVFMIVWSTCGFQNNVKIAVEIACCQHRHVKSQTASSYHLQLTDASVAWISLYICLQQGSYRVLTCNHEWSNQLCIYLVYTPQQLATSRETFCSYTHPSWLTRRPCRHIPHTWPVCMHEARKAFILSPDSASVTPHCLLAPEVLVLPVIAICTHHFLDFILFTSHACIVSFVCIISLWLLSKCTILYFAGLTTIHCAMRESSRYVTPPSTSCLFCTASALHYI